MEVEESQMFVAHEIDFDYEFEAFFLGVQEILAQACQAQL